MVICFGFWSYYLCYDFTFLHMKNLLTFVFVVFSKLLLGQCVMCRVAAEQSDYASGINEGILYLMPLPAILILTIGWILYYNYKKKVS